jgi:predicted nuclease of predicted toxin-antitoxin system
VKFLVDECLSPDWAGLFRSLGHEAVHWREVGEHGDPDPKLIEWARKNDAIVFTKDMDFSKLLYLSRESLPSVLQLRKIDVLAGYTRMAVIEAVTRFSRQLEEGCLVSISSRGTRVRVLPLP